MCLVEERLLIAHFGLRLPPEAQLEWKVYIGKFLDIGSTNTQLNNGLSVY
jgi:hypothetical protein